MTVGHEAEKPQIHGQHGEPRSGGCGRSGEKPRGPGGLAGIVERHVEARQAERAAHGQDQGDNPAQGAQLVERPDIDKDGRCHAEIDEVGERVEFGAEARGALEKARQPPVGRIEQNGENDSAHRQFETALDSQPDGGDAAAQRQQGYQVGQKETDRHLLEARRAFRHVLENRIAGQITLAFHRQLLRPRRPGSADSRSARTVSPAIARCPTLTKGSTLSGR